MKENERAEITEEVIGDTIDDAMADENSEAQEDAIVNQVLDELGISVSESVPGELIVLLTRALHCTPH